MKKFYDYESGMGAVKEAFIEPTSIAVKEPRFFEGFAVKGSTVLEPLFIPLSPGSIGAQRIRKRWD